MNARITTFCCRPPRASRGFMLELLAIGVAVGLIALGGAAAGLSVVLNSHNNRQTANILTDPEATTQQLESISDQDLRNLRNDLRDNMELSTLYTGVGTTTLPGGGSTARVAANALEEQIRTAVSPAVIDYMSDPESSWNRNGGSERPSEGTVPSGGLLPEEIAGGTGDVRFTLVWNAHVDLDLHVLDPCGVEIYFNAPSNSCNGNLGELDVDNISGGPESTENIFWGDGAAPTGSYQYWVVCYSGCNSEPASFTLSRTVDGHRTSTSETLATTGGVSQVITFTR